MRYGDSRLVASAPGIVAARRVVVERGATKRSRARWAAASPGSGRSAATVGAAGAGRRARRRRSGVARAGDGRWQAVLAPGPEVRRCTPCTPPPEPVRNVPGGTAHGLSASTSRPAVGPSAASTRRLGAVRGRRRPGPVHAGTSCWRTSCGTRRPGRRGARRASRRARRAGRRACRPRNHRRLAPATSHSAVVEHEQRDHRAAGVARVGDRGGEGVVVGEAQVPAEPHDRVRHGGSPLPAPPPDRSPEYLVSSAYGMRARPSPRTRSARRTRAALGRGARRTSAAAAL